MEFKSALIAILMFACVTSAQEAPNQPQIGLTVPNCNTTTTKPKPTPTLYAFETCIVAKFAAYLTIGQDKYLELNNGIVDQNATHCEKIEGNNTVINPKLVVNFTCGQLEFEIERTTNDSKIFIKSINGKYSDMTFSNATRSFITNESGHYYKCNAEQSVSFGNSNVHLILSNFAYEAFRTAVGTDFYKIPEECALDAGQVSDLVRIGVGVCLVALVVIVLIAYFVGRRRWSERSSYESV